MSMAQSRYFTKCRSSEITFNNINILTITVFQPMYWSKAIYEVIVNHSNWAQNIFVVHLVLWHFVGVFQCRYSLALIGANGWYSDFSRYFDTLSQHVFNINVNSFQYFGDFKAPKWAIPHLKVTQVLSMAAQCCPRARSLAINYRRELNPCSNKTGTLLDLILISIHILTWRIL